MSISKTVIITGSSSGIGLDVARAFLDRGDNVVLNGRDAAKLTAVEASLGVPERTAAVAGDIGDPRTGQALARAALDRFGGADVLVNNAGTFAAKPFTDVTEAELDGYLQGNLKGTYMVTQAAVRLMRQSRRGGAIVNIGTALVDHAVGGFPASAPVASKGAVQALTVSLAAELAPDNIRVTMVSPGVIRSPLHAGVDVDAFGGLALLNRVGETAEIAAAVLFLADAEFTTGHVLSVDGGFVTGRA